LGWVVKKQAEQGALWFGNGTIACAIAHNLGDLQAAMDPAVLQEASKTGAVLMMMIMSGHKFLEQRKDTEA